VSATTVTVNMDGSARIVSRIGEGRPTDEPTVRMIAGALREAESEKWRRFGGVEVDINKTRWL
jgi:hypothetical protein